MRVVAKLSKEHYSCFMCSYSGQSDRYIAVPYIVDMDKEHTICGNCAKREHGSKNKLKLKDVIDERTKIWLQRKNQDLDYQKQ